MAFPVIQATATGRLTTAGTSHSITLPSGIVAGEMLFVLIAGDSNQPNFTVASGSGWYKWNWSHDGTALTSTVFWKYATGSDALTLTSSISTTSAHFSARISGAKSFSADRDIGTTNDPSGGTYGGKGRGYERLNLLVLVNDGNSTGVTPPTGYTLLTNSSSPNATTGESIATASKTSYGARAGENPGAWTLTAGNTSRNAWHFAFDDVPWNEPGGCIAREETKIDTATTSHTIVMPGNISRGDLIHVFAGFAADTTISVNTGSSGNGWTIVGQASQATTGPAAIALYKVSDGSDALVLTSSVSTTSKAASMLWEGVSHITGAFIGGAAGVSADPDLADQAASATYDSDTATGIGGNWDADMIVGSYYVTAAASSYGFGDGGTSVANATAPSISNNSLPFGITNTNALNWGSWSLTPANPWVVGVSTFWPKFVRQPRYVGYNLADVAGGSGTTTLAFSGTTYLNKTSAGAGSGGQIDIFFTADGIQPGDMIIAVNAVGTSGRNPPLAVTGYTTLADTLVDGTTYDTRLWVGYKFMGATPDTSVVFPRSGNNADAQNVQYIIARGIDPDSPIDGSVIIRGAAGTGVPSDYARATWRGAVATRTSPLLSRAGNNYIRVAAGAAATSVALTPPTDNWFFLQRTSVDTNDSHLTTSWVFPVDQPEGWSDTSTDTVLTTGWTGGTTGATDSWAEVIVPLNAMLRPRHGAILKVWNGTAWLPQQFRVWDGSKWVFGSVRVWDGSKWKVVTNNQYQ